MADKAGRQSPPPEHQTKAQVAPDKNAGQIDAASDNFSKDASNETKNDVLESNPTHSTLEDAAKNKVTKDGRGEGV